MLHETKRSRLEITALLGNIAILLFANALTLYLFAVQHSSVWQIVFTYFVQTAAIVYFYYRRIFGANVTQIAYRLYGASVQRKLYELQNETAYEQVLFLLVFGMPLAVMFFIIVLNYSGNTFFGAVPITISAVNFWSVLVGSAIFLGHHMLSYAFHLWEYRRGQVDQVTLPVVRIAVRVYTLLVLLFALPIVFSSGKTNMLFYLFIGIKTVLDIVLSSSYTLIHELQRQTTTTPDTASAQP